MIILAKERVTVCMTKSTRLWLNNNILFNDYSCLLDKRFNILVTKLDGPIFIGFGAKEQFVYEYIKTKKDNIDIYSADYLDITYNVTFNQVNDFVYIKLDNDVSQMNVKLTEDVFRIIQYLVKQFIINNPNQTYVLSYNEIYNQNKIFGFIPKCAFPDYIIDYKDDPNTNEKAFYFTKP